MTFLLTERLKKRFPDINGSQRVDIYENYERIYLNLIAREFLNSPYINPLEELEKLALETFDAHFICEPIDNKKDIGLRVSFLPKILPKSKMSQESFEYQSRYSEHTIEISLPANHPEITISTGNRGRGNLLDKQRDLYFKFIEGVYNIFLKK